MNIVDSIVIHQPRSRVWQYLTDPSNTAVYWPGMIEYEATSPAPYGVGTTMAGKTRFAGVTVELQHVITSFTDLELSEWSSTDPRNPAVQSFRFSDVDEGTRVEYEVDGLRPGLVGKVTDPVFAAMMRRTVRNGLENIKDLLEAATG